MRYESLDDVHYPSRGVYLVGKLIAVNTDLPTLSYVLLAQYTVI